MSRTIDDVLAGYSPEEHRRALDKVLADMEDVEPEPVEPVDEYDEWYENEWRRELREERGE